MASHLGESDLTGVEYSKASGILKPPGDSVHGRVGELVGWRSLLDI